MSDVIDKCPLCGFGDLAHDYTRVPMCLEIDGGCGWDGTMLFTDQPDSHMSLINAWDAAIESGSNVYAAGERLRFALEAVRTVVNRYAQTDGDGEENIEPEDGWRLIRDLRELIA